MVLIPTMFMLGGVHLRKFPLARVSYRMTFWFCILFTWCLGHLISRYLNVHLISINYTRDSKSQTLRMCYPFQSTGIPIFHRSMWSFRVYMIPLRDFVPEWNSRPGTTTGVTSRRASMTFCGGIMWTNVELWEGTGVNLLRGESRPGVM